MMTQANPDVFVFLFSVVNRDTLIEHQTRYYKEGILYFNYLFYYYLLLFYFIF